MASEHLSSEDMTVEAQEAARKRLDGLLNALTAWRTWAGVTATAGRTDEELREALDKQYGTFSPGAKLKGWNAAMDLLRAEVGEEGLQKMLAQATANVAEVRPIDAWTDLNEFEGALGPDHPNWRREVEEWTHLAADLLQIDVDLDNDLEADRQDYLRHHLEEMTLAKTAGVEPATLERLKKETPEWMTVDRAVVCLLDNLFSRRMKELTVTLARTRHPEWFVQEGLSSKPSDP